MIGNLTTEQIGILEAVAPWLLSDGIKYYNAETLRLRLGHKSRQITYRWLSRNGIERLRLTDGRILIPREALIAHILRCNNASETL